MGVFNFLSGDELKAAKQDASFKDGILSACTSNIAVVDSGGEIHYHTPAFLNMIQQYDDDFHCHLMGSSLVGHRQFG